MDRVSQSASASSTLVRAIGFAAAAFWACLALLDRAAWPLAGLVALGLSVAAAIVLRPVARLRSVLMTPSRRVFVSGCALVATALSWRVSQDWFHGIPGGIDSAVYLMQARAMSHLHFGMLAPVPLQSFSNHFVFEGPDRRLYGVFPPGWSLALVPFVWLGAPMLAGPALAALLVVAQATLGRALGLASGAADDGELATRLSLLLSLPSYARAVETADLLSHAFVAVLVSFALALAIRAPARAAAERSIRKGPGIALGVCLGWVACTRLLDGAVLMVAVAGVLAWTRPGRGVLFWAVAGSVPFLLLLAIEQRCATGAWLLPTQTAYFERSDWPPDCHRLGFGHTVGCTLEHSKVVASFGPGGYDAKEALVVTAERARVLGEDLFGFAPLTLLAFAPLALAASAVDVIAVAFLLGLTVAYALFYYGNSAIYGARHLFPAAPAVWLLAARASVGIPRRAWPSPDAHRAQGACMAALLAVSAVCSRWPWWQHRAAAIEQQAGRSELRRSLERHAIDRGILKSLDQAAVAAAFDPWRDVDERFFVVDDRSALVELRRAHPHMPFMLSLPGDDVATLHATRPPPGILVELERAWPTFVRPSGLGVSRESQDGASGGQVLRLTHGHPGAEVAVPFEIAVAGDYVVRVDGAVGPEQGDYGLLLDGAPLPDWHGYEARSALKRGVSSARELAAGRHLLVARCVGQDERSNGFDARLDALVGEVRETP
jgi:hypothetical protein